MARMDVHCHSVFSGRTHHWIWHKMGAKESYTKIEDLYQILKSRGMDFVTVTDHDSIEGALELAANHDDAFISCEFTVRFPNDEGETHLCAYDIDEEQFRMARYLSADIREFAQYMREQDVLVTVPHPLYGNFGKLSTKHLEQLVLLFEFFEEKNGMMLPAINETQKNFLDSLTPERIEFFSKKHAIAPAFDEPWKKGRLAGSDDHSGFYLGSAYTEVESAKSYKQFLDGIRAKKSTPHGLSCDSHRFAHTVHFNVVESYANMFYKSGSFVEQAVDSIDRICGYQKEDIMTIVKTTPVPNVPSKKNPAQDEMLDEAIERLMAQDWNDVDLLMNRVEGHNLQQETFSTINTLFNTLIREGVKRFVGRIREGRVIDAISKLAIASPSVFLFVPYIQTLEHVYADNKFRKEAEKAYDLPRLDEKTGEKWAWFTDTIVDVNGVARTIQTVSKLAENYDTPITTMTCHPEKPDFEGNIKNFDPIFHFSLPEYESMVMAMPPVLEMLHYCEEQKFSRFIISTPGPLGFTALAVAKILGIPTSGIYHTDIPNYARILTGDAMVEWMAWKLVQAFYNNVDTVYVLTNTYRERLITNGVDHEDIRIFPKGTNVDLFHPDRRDMSVWKRYGLNGSLKLLYVGRVSKEKGLTVLRDAFMKIRQERNDVDLIIVGDGPYYDELRAGLTDTKGVIFTGFVEGEALADLFAASDIFVFPSATDTYGSVVLEAQASGLPVVVTDEGGPKEVIIDGKTGYVTKAHDVDDFTAAIVKLVESEDLREEMGYAGRLHAENKSWENAFKTFWETTPKRTKEDGEQEKHLQNRQNNRNMN